jgi:UDP:flavonoid glycosyltransferase YjiC (YdhE family)
MRVVFVTFPVPSHYFPMVPLGWAMRAAGHEVRVTCPPSLTATVTGSGLPAVTIPEVDLASFWRGFATPPGGGPLDELWQRCDAPGADPLGAVTVDPCPPSLQIPAPVVRKAIRYLPYNGPAVAPDWLLAPPARPRVCISAGSALPGRKDMVAAARQAVGALAGLDAEVVVAAGGNPDLLEPIPAGFRVLERMPLHLLLPTCAAIVHHGGAGTTLTAAACGVPQLLLPDGGDRFLHAGQLSGAGAGIAISQVDATPAAILDGARTLLADSSYRHAARRLQQEMARQATPVQIVDALAALAAPAYSRNGSR